MIRRSRVLVSALAVLLALVTGGPCRAQLATSFYNVTSIRTRRMPNAVQITINTDGAVQFGIDVMDVLTFLENDIRPKPTTALRLRLLRARSRVPALSEIGAYPVDSAVVSLGEDAMQMPFFSVDDWWQARPLLDITLRFYVPVTVMQFASQSGRSGEDGDGGNGIQFSDRLAQLQASVAMGQDQRSIVITVVSDRVDFGRAANIKRSPKEGHHRRLSVTRTDGDRVRLDALHAPLVEVVDALSEASSTPVVCRSDAADVDVSLYLPSTTVDGALRALERGCGLAVTRLAEGAGAAWSVGRDGPASVTEVVPLRHLSPTQARALLPDFLLPMVRVDDGANALVTAGPRDMVDRLKRDVLVLDQPRPQVRVQAQVWEIASSDALAAALTTEFTRGGQSQRWDSGLGEVTVRLSDYETRQVTAAVQALASRGKARMSAQPYVVVASGATGTVFLGQQRHVTVLGSGYEQTVDALKLQVGHSLTVVPTLAADGAILLDLAPRTATLAAVERGTGLPTLAIREAMTSLRLTAGDTVLVGVLGTELRSMTDGATARVSAARRGSGDAAMTLVLVNARRES